MTVQINKTAGARTGGRLYNRNPRRSSFHRGSVFYILSGSNDWLRTRPPLARRGRDTISRNAPRSTLPRACTCRFTHCLLLSDGFYRDRNGEPTPAATIRVGKKKGSSNERLRDIRLPLTSWAGMTCHARREFFVSNCNIFSVLSIFRCNPGRTNDKFITSQ